MVPVSWHGMTEKTKNLSEMLIKNWCYFPRLFGAKNNVNFSVIFHPFFQAESSRTFTHIFINKN